MWKKFALWVSTAIVAMVAFLANIATISDFVFGQKDSAILKKEGLAENKKSNNISITNATISDSNIVQGEKSHAEINNYNNRDTTIANPSIGDKSDIK